MVNVPVNENIDTYKNTVVMGLTPTQTVSLLVAVFLGSIEFLLVHYLLHLPLMICSLIIIPTAGAVVMGMNYEKDGLNLIEIIQSGKYKKGFKILFYESTETILSYGDVSAGQNLDFEGQVTKKEENFERQTKVLILAMILGLIVLVGCAIGLVMFMS